ncbi:MAG: hypothetical protein Q8P45_02570 [Candidatus Harrisonbacteria bacterium]|nr:hypothetical protein [Candidatus Harrisonbacteria bacterium]
MSERFPQPKEKKPSKLLLGAIFTASLALAGLMKKDDEPTMPTTPLKAPSSTESTEQPQGPTLKGSKQEDPNELRKPAGQDPSKALNDANALKEDMIEKSSANSATLEYLSKDAESVFSKMRMINSLQDELKADPDYELNQDVKDAYRELVENMKKILQPITADLADPGNMEKAKKIEEEFNGLIEYWRREGLEIPYIHLFNG